LGGVVLTEDQLTEVIEEADDDKDGQIDPLEFR